MEHRKIFMLRILKILHVYCITLAGSKFSSGTLPTMHSIYVYTDIYQGLQIFANSYIYIYICLNSQPTTPLLVLECNHVSQLLLYILATESGLNNLLDRPKSVGAYVATSSYTMEEYVVLLTTACASQAEQLHLQQYFPTFKLCVP